MLEFNDKKLYEKPKPKPQPPKKPKKTKEKGNQNVPKKFMIFILSAFSCFILALFVAVGEGGVAVLSFLFVAGTFALASAPAPHPVFNDIKERAGKHLTGQSALSFGLFLTILTASIVISWLVFPEYFGFLFPASCVFAAVSTFALTKYKERLQAVKK